MRNNRLGYTMIEMIMTIAIGSVLVGGLVLFSQQIMLSAVKARNLSISLHLAIVEIERANVMDYSTLVAGTTDLPVTLNHPGFKARRIVSIVNIPPPPPPTGGGTAVSELRRIDIKVDLATGNFSNPLVQLTTYRNSYLLFSPEI